MADTDFVKVTHGRIQQGDQAKRLAAVFWETVTPLAVGTLIADYEYWEFRRLKNLDQQRVEELRLELEAQKQLTKKVLKQVEDILMSNNVGASMKLLQISHTLTQLTPG